MSAIARANMQNHQAILTWATDYLKAKTHFLQQTTEIVVDTPWSTVIRLSTSKEIFYLKQSPPALFLEPKIIQLLAEKLDPSVPVVIASNHELHCFLMKDAGLSLRGYLKTEFRSDLLSQAVQQYTTIQRSAESHINSFFLELGVPDWRLNKLPPFYQQIINQIIV